jgi:L-malate glycosyltransferase
VMPPVLHVLMGPGGGAWEMLRTLAAHQRGRRFVAIGVSRGHRQRGDGLRAQGERSADCWLEHVFSDALPFGSAVGLPPVASWIAKVAQEAGSEPVVHLHNGVASGLFLLPGRRVLRGAGAVATFHGLVPGDEVNGSTSFGWRRLLHGALARRVAEAGVTCVGVSQTSAERIMARYGIPGNRRFRVVLNGVDTPPRMQSAFRRSQKYTCCFIGQLSRHKNWETAARAVAELRSNGVPVELVVAGDGCDRRRVEGLASRGGTLVFLGPGESAASRVIAHSDVLILPSVSEGLPLVALEALAVGVPVVLTRQAGGEEIVRTPLVGRTVPGDGCRLVAQAVLELIRCKGPEQQAACKEEHARRFTADRMCADYACIYENARATGRGMEKSRGSVSETRAACSGYGPRFGGGP